MRDLLDPLALASVATLPRGHVFHPACVKGLRSFGEDDARLFLFQYNSAKSANGSRGALTAEERKHMDEVDAGD